MKILVSILSALTLTTTITISSVPMSYTKTLKKHKIKHQKDDEKDNEADEKISPQEEQKQIKHAKRIVNHLENKDFSFTDNKSIAADGKKTWKQVFSILEHNVSQLFNFEDDEKLNDLDLKLLSFNFAFASDNELALTENSIIVSYSDFIGLEISILPKWKKQWDKKQKIKTKINLKVGGKNQQEVNNVLSESIANDITNNIVFSKGYISKTKQGLHNGITFKNQDLIDEIEKLFKTDLKAKYQEKWSLDIKNENGTEQSQTDLIAGDKIFTISIAVGTNEQQVILQIKKLLYVSVKIEDQQDANVLLEQTGKYLINQIDNAISLLSPMNSLNNIIWYNNFINQLIEIYKEKHYNIDSINVFDVQNGSYPDLIKTFKTVVQKDTTVLEDFKSIIDWISEARYFEKIALKFKTLKDKFGENKIQIKFIQQIGEQTYNFSDNTAIQSIYKNYDASFVQQESKIMLEIWVDSDKKITLETKTVAFSQFGESNNCLAAFLATALENMLNKA